MSKHIDYEINRELGECYLFMGEYEKAAGYYKKALECETAYAAPYLGLAAIALQHGDIDQARQYYATAVEIEPNEKTFTGLALAEMEQGHDQSAFGNFLSALDHNPVNIMAMNGLVQLGYKLGLLEEVINRLRSALEVEDNEAMRFTLAGCMSYLGRKDEAREQLEILLGQNPSNTGAQELYAHLAA